MSEASRFAAIVLAGGKSTRLGRDKASESLLGKTLLERVVSRFDGLVGECIIVRARGQVLPTLTRNDVKIVEDFFPETGPLGGIYSGLAACISPYGIVAACDMPLLQPALLAELLRLSHGEDLVVPVNRGLMQPLCAVYSKGCLEVIRSQLSRGSFKVTDLFEFLKPRVLLPNEWKAFDPDGLSFQNLNRDEDLVRAKRLLLREQHDRTRL
ncbi:MAG: NTP transferase domain-containing protein [Dehalococcoidia bacterium]|nr:NTP transferase domain-containing protein [Dehalococcoidia bacterium]